MLSKGCGDGSAEDVCGCGWQKAIRSAAGQRIEDSGMNEILINVTRWAMLAFLIASMLELGLSLSFGQVLAPKPQWLLRLRLSRRIPAES